MREPSMPGSVVANCTASASVLCHSATVMVEGSRRSMANRRLHLDSPRVMTIESWLARLYGFSSAYCALHDTLQHEQVRLTCRNANEDVFSNRHTRFHLLVASEDLERRGVRVVPALAENV